MIQSLSYYLSRCSSNTKAVTSRILIITVLDSNGAFTINKIDGSVASIGGYDECLSIRVPQIDQTNKVKWVGHFIIRKDPLNRIISFRISPSSNKKNQVFCFKLSASVSVTSTMSTDRCVEMMCKLQHCTGARYI